MRTKNHFSLIYYARIRKNLHNVAAGHSPPFSETQTKRKWKNCKDRKTNTLLNLIEFPFADVQLVSLLHANILVLAGTLCLLKINFIVRLSEFYSQIWKWITKTVGSPRYDYCGIPNICTSTSAKWYCASLCSARLECHPLDCNQKQWTNSIFHSLATDFAAINRKQCPPDVHDLSARALHLTSSVRYFLRYTKICCALKSGQIVPFYLFSLSTR